MSETNSQAQSTPKNLIVFVVILFLLAATVFIFYLISRNSGEQTNTGTIMNESFSTDEFTADYSRTKNIYTTGNNQTLAVDEFKKILTTNLDKEQEGKVKILLASSLSARNEGSDAYDAITLYKEVATDLTFPPYIRALALNNIAGKINTNDITFYNLYLNDAPFNEFLPKTGSDAYKIAKASMRIYELSIQTFPTSFAKYAIAGSYYASALVDVSGNTKSERLENTDVKEVARTMQKLVEEGDALKDEHLHVLHTNLLKYFYRALAIASSGRILENIDLDEREESHKLVLLKGIERNQGDELSLEILMRARFYYANFLYRNYGDERHDSIKTILAPYQEMATGDSYAALSTRKYFFQNITSKDGNFVKVTIF